jgi:hypothetical protein
MLTPDVASAIRKAKEELEPWEMVGAKSLSPNGSHSWDIVGRVPLAVCLLWRLFCNFFATVYGPLCSLYLVYFGPSFSS